MLQLVHVLCHVSISYQHLVLANNDKSTLPFCDTKLFVDSRNFYSEYHVAYG